MNMVAHDKLIHNLKMAKIMKCTGRSDSEIATYCEITVADFLDILDNDTYLQNVFENAQDQIATEIEEKFLTKVLEKLDEGDSTDAKFVLERTMPKYSRKDKVEVGGSLSIDEIIKGQTKSE